MVLSHTGSCSSSKHWCRPITTRSNAGFNVFPKDTWVGEAGTKPVIFWSEVDCSTSAPNNLLNNNSKAMFDCRWLNNQQYQQLYLRLVCILWVHWKRRVNYTHIQLSGDLNHWPFSWNNTGIFKQFMKSEACFFSTHQSACKAIFFCAVSVKIKYSLKYSINTELALNKV